MEGACNTNGGEEERVKVIGGKVRGKEAAKKTKWVNNIKKDIREIGVDWIGLSQDRDRWKALLNVVMNLRVLYNARKLSSAFTTGGLSSSPQLHRVS
jgi:hypothetical protein